MKRARNNQSCRICRLRPRKRPRCFDQNPVGQKVLSLLRLEAAPPCMQVCQLEQWMAFAMLIAAAAVFMMLEGGITAPYGRFSLQACKMWPKMDNRMAWMVSWTSQNGSYMWPVQHLKSVNACEDAGDVELPGAMLAAASAPEDAAPGAASLSSSLLLQVLPLPPPAPPKQSHTPSCVGSCFHVHSIQWPPAGVFVAAQMHQLGQRLQPSKWYTAAGQQPDLLLR